MTTFKLQALLEWIVTSLSGHAISTDDEAVLSKHVALLLAKAGIEYSREVSLTARDRIDYLVQGVGLELKVGGSAASIIRQLDRYAQSERIDALVLVTTRRSHRYLPEHLHGKPVECVLMGGM